MRIRSSFALIGGLSLSGLVVVACGGDSTNSGFAPGTTDAGAGGRGSGSGGANAGGGGASNGGSAGSGGKGGGTATGGASSGGASGAGGTDAGSACNGPKNPNDTTLCVHVMPQQLKPLAQPQLDQKGIFAIQVFDIPNPPDQNADQIALATQILPPGAALGDAGTGQEIDLANVKDVTLEGTFPSTVYVRAFFVDNPEAIGRKDLGYGVWLGGIDLSGGLKDKLPLTAVPVTIGQGNSLDLPLTAFRLLHVTVHLDTTPIGDGQGPLTVVAVNGEDPAAKPALFGVGTKPCTDVAAKDVNVNGIVFGSGKLWVTGILNDLGAAGDLPPGSLASLDLGSLGYSIPTSITLGDQYAIQTTVNLGFAVPRPADAGAIPPNSCTDLFGGADAGP